MLSLSLVSCSTMRLRYEVQLTSVKDDRAARFIFEKSYDLSSESWTCGLTAVFLGGYCWAYQKMPSKAQSEKIRQEALLRLDDTMGMGKYVIESDSVARMSWAEAPPYQKFEYLIEVPNEI